MNYLDFPTAWAIQRAGGFAHHERCSSVPSEDPITGPAFLCDCGAVTREWRRLREAGLPMPSALPPPTEPVDAAAVERLRALLAPGGGA